MTVTAINDQCVGWAKPVLSIVEGRSVPNIKIWHLRSLGTLRFAQPTGRLQEDSRPFLVPARPAYRG